VQPNIRFHAGVTIKPQTLTIWGHGKTALSTRLLAALDRIVPWTKRVAPDAP